MRHRTSINSLFLDKGFGSLDGATLEIGIISHVEALKERIPAQIRVKKVG